jgi:signal transduction histidine kinase/CheY-like chemotaxis protein
MAEYSTPRRDPGDEHDAHRSVEQMALDSQRELAAQVDGLQILHGMSLKLLGTHDLGTLLNGVLLTATELSGTDIGLIALFEEPERKLRIGASLGMSEQAVERLARMDENERPCGLAFGERRRVIVEDLQTNPAYASLLPIAREVGFQAVHSAPLVSRSGAVLGVLTVYFRVPRRPPAREMQLLDLCARQAVDLIENANLYGRLRLNDRRKDEFLAVLAHELRNPLAPIQNAVRLARTPGEAPGTTQAALDVIERQVKHMSRLVGDLTDLSRISTGRLDLQTESITVQQLFDAALETSRPSIDACSQKLRVALPDRAVVLNGDLTRLAQVLTNLLNNASKYSDRGGRITLEAIVERPGTHVTISVRDTGMGMSPEMVGRVFNVFEHPVDLPTRTRGGLGVGLTLARRLVELHGGTIDAYSPGPGRGSRFTVRLPIQMGSTIDETARTTATAISNAKDEANGMSPLRVLVVDDNVDSAETMAMLLTHLGHEVRTAHDGQAAIDVAEDFHPEAILLDIGLPIRSGHDVARELRRRTWAESAKIIAMSGWGRETDRQSSREAGFDYHLVKPIDHAELRRLLEPVGA